MQEKKVFLFQVQNHQIFYQNIKAWNLLSQLRPLIIFKNQYMCLKLN